MSKTLLRQGLLKSAEQEKEEKEQKLQQEELFPYEILFSTKPAKQEW